MRREPPAGPQRIHPAALCPLHRSIIERSIGLDIQACG
jgi:hypothetical protein